MAASAAALPQTGTGFAFSQVHVPSSTFVTTRLSALKNGDKQGVFVSYLEKVMKCYESLKKEHNFYKLNKLQNSLAAVINLTNGNASIETTQSLDKLKKRVDKTIKKMHVVNLEQSKKQLEKAECIVYESQSGNHWYLGEDSSQSTMTKLSLSWDISKTITKLKQSPQSPRAKLQILFNMHRALMEVVKIQESALKQPDHKSDEALKKDLRETKAKAKEIRDRLSEVIPDELVYVTLQEVRCIEKGGAVFDELVKLIDPTGIKQIKGIIYKMRAPENTENIDQYQYQRVIKRITTVLASLKLDHQFDKDVIAFMKKNWSLKTEDFGHLPNANAPKRHLLVSLLWRFAIGKQVPGSEEALNFSTCDHLALSYLMNFLDPVGTIRAKILCESAANREDFYFKKGVLLTQLAKFDIQTLPALKKIRELSTFAFVLDRITHKRFFAFDFSEIAEQLLRIHAELFVKFEEEQLLRDKIDAIPSVQAWLTHHAKLQNWVSDQIVSRRWCEERGAVMTAFHVLAYQMIEMGDPYSALSIYQGATAYMIDKEARERVPLLLKSGIAWIGDWQAFPYEQIVEELEKVFSGFKNFEELRLAEKRVAEKIPLQLPFPALVFRDLATAREVAGGEEMAQRIQGRVNDLLRHQMAWKAWLEDHPPVKRKIDIRTEIEGHAILSIEKLEEKLEQHAKQK